jgi:hypothetical protein
MSVAGASGARRVGGVSREWGRVLLHVGVWAAVLAAGAALLRGRFDLSPPALEHTRRSYASSLFLFVLTVPTAYYLLRGPTGPTLRPRVALAFSAALFTLLTLPYRWLGLTRWHHEINAVLWSDTSPAPQLSFLPTTFPVESFPGERLFFPALMIAFALIAIVAMTRWMARPAPTPRAALRVAGPWIAAYAAILLQSWLHTGLRSGYTIAAFFETGTEQDWHSTYLFPDRQGAVNADFPYFWSLDRYFQGVPELPRTMIFHRPFAHYLGSQLSYFINPFLVYLVLNTLLWLAAAGCFHAFVLRVSGRARLATWAAAFVCIGNGFSYFVAQPKFYVAGYAATAMSLYAFDVLQSDAAHGGDSMFERWLRVLLCGVALGLLAATYDAQPMLCGLVALAVYRRFNLLRALVSVGIGFAVPWAYAKLQFGVLGLEVDLGNQGIAEEVVRNVRELVAQPQRGQIYYLVSHWVPTLAQNLTFAFMFVALALATLGVFVAQRSRERWLIVTLLVPTLLLDLVLCLGHVTWYRWAFAELARLSYIAYPAIYLGAALALDRLAGRGNSGFRTTAAWSALVLVGVWQSCDAFGFVSPVVHFYFPDQTPWLNPI